MARIVVVCGRERLNCLWDCREAGHAEPVWQDGARARMLHDNGPAAREMTKASDRRSRRSAGRLGAAEIAARLLDIAPAALGGARDLPGISDMPAMALQQLPLLLVEDPQRQLERLRGMAGRSSNGRKATRFAFSTSLPSSNNQSWPVQLDTVVNAPEHNASA